MKGYLIKKRPKITMNLALIFFVSTILRNILTKIFYQIDDYILLYPYNLYEPLNWYRLLTYPFYIYNIIVWFHIALVITLTGYIVENRIKKIDLYGLIILSCVAGGLIYIIINRNDELNIPIASPVMITWGYWAAAIVIGFRFWRSLNLFEKIIVICCVISILSLWNDNYGYIIGQLTVIVLVMIITFIKIKQIKSRTTEVEMESQ